MLEGGTNGTDRSASSVPPHIHPPIAQVPIATGDTLSDVPGISVSAMFTVGAFAWSSMIASLSLNVWS